MEKKKSPLSSEEKKKESPTPPKKRERARDTGMVFPFGKVIPLYGTTDKGEA